MVRLSPPPVPLENPHRGRDDVHYRLYVNAAGAPIVICLRWFDYPDCDPARFLSVGAFDTEEEAHEGLSTLLADLGVPNRPGVLS